MGRVAAEKWYSFHLYLISLFFLSVLLYKFLEIFKKNGMIHEDVTHIFK